MAAKRDRTVCGIPVNAAGPLYWKLGSSLRTGDPSQGLPNSSIYPVSKPEALRLMQALFGLSAKRPRMMTKIKLCDDQYLVNYHGSFEIHREAPGDLRGPKKRRRRRK